MKKLLCLNSNILKLLACLFMLIDHLALFLSIYVNNVDSNLIFAFRIIGRISLPIFIYLLFEGAEHTSNLKKYFLKLIIMYAIIAIGILVYNEAIIGGNANYEIYNIFATLTISLLAYVSIFKFEKYYKLIVIVPILLFVFTFLIKYNFLQLTTKTVIILQSFLPDYPLFSFILTFSFILFKWLYDYRIKKTLQIDGEINSFKVTKDYRLSLNVLFSFSIFLCALVAWGLTYVSSFDQNFMSIETYIIIAIPFILLYNGKLGIKNKIIQYSFYLFYIAHLLILFLIFEII